MRKFITSHRDTLIRMKSYLNVQRLAALVSSKRDKRPLREIAEETGVSPSTLSRVENFHTPDMISFLALCNWLQVHPGDLFGVSGELPPLNTADDITVKLLSDKNIDPDIANALAVLIKAAYHDF